MYQVGYYHLLCLICCQQH